MAAGRRQLIRSLLAAAALLLLALAALLASTRMSRTLIGRLRRLRDDTLELADVRLPDLVERLRRGDRVDVEAEVAPAEHPDDEIGDVAGAFDKAQRTAVLAAAREAETRAGSSKVFLNIARRSQVIMHRQLRVLDQAERAQEDPEQLRLLFELDHLATRARRNAENLIILGGGQAGRQWRQPVGVYEVTRSAIGESERYVRVTTSELPAVRIDGAAVADVVHLLAELVDNATNFSPPNSRVEVRGNPVGRGVVIEIEDQGLGIEPGLRDELNDVLHHPPDFSMMALSEEPRLGLFVVAQLAARHGIKVSLIDSPHYGGTRAVVLIPTAVLSAPEAETADSAEPSGESGPRADEQEPAPVPASIPIPPAQIPRPHRRHQSRPGESSAPRTGPVAQPVNGAVNGSALGPATGSVPGPASGPIGAPVSGRRAATAPVTAPNGLPLAAERPSARPDAPGDRPELPRRVRQANLVPQLMGDDSGPGPVVAPRDSPPSAPEQVRDRFAALQRGTRQARDVDSGPSEASEAGT